MRWLVGCDYDRKETDGKLSILDLSEAKIVAGGSAYVLYYGNNIYTSNDKLGDGAFYGCSGLTSLTIPSGVTSIGRGAFEGCSGLTSLTIPSSVTEIGNWAFLGCSGLTSLTIPSGVTEIGESAFQGCRGLTSLTIPSGVTSIGGYAFWGCSGLTSLTIPSGVTSIGGYAFWGCSGLTSLTIPSSVTSIGRYAFRGCSGLTSLTLPSGVTSIGIAAFDGCSGLTSLTIPSGVTSIGDEAFRGCSSLTSIYACLEKIPELGPNTFTGFDAKNCILYVPTGTLDDYLVSDFGCFKHIVDGINKDGLLTTQVTIKLDEAGTLPDKISANEKNLITNLKIVGKINGTDLKFIREMAGSDFNREKTDGKLSILDLSEAKIVAGGSAYVLYYGNNIYTSNDKLGDSAFYGCSGLTSLTIPSSVTSIGRGAFEGCSGLTSLTIPSGVTWIGSEAFRGCSGLTSLTIPSGVTSISDFAFYGCSGLTSLTIPSGVTSISDFAFKGCSGLTSLTIPSGVTSIGWNAFYGCSGLTSLTIPSSVTSIGGYAFYGCSGLTSIYAYLEKIPTLGSNVFTGCDAKNCTVYVPKGTYDAYKSSEFGYFENIVDGINKDGLLTTQVTIKLDEAGTLPDRIGENQKYLITNLKIVGKINGTDLKFIREMAGRDFNREKTDGKLSVLDLSEAKIVAGGSAYISYNGFCQYTYNDKLGDYTFKGCSGLTSMIIPSGVTAIGKEAFYGCSGLTSLTIPSSVTSIGNWAFDDCSGLTSIYVYPENLPELGTGIFNGCDAKNCTVYVPKGTIDDYKLSKFGYFEKIVEFDASGIDKVATSTNAKEVSRYSANGQRLSAPAKGLNIVKYSDGSVKKVVVQ